MTDPAHPTRAPQAPGAPHSPHPAPEVGSADLEASAGTTGAAMALDDLPIELRKLAVAAMNANDALPEDEQDMTPDHILAAVLPSYEALVRAEVAAEIEAYAEATARQQAAIPVFCSGLRKGAEIARGEA